jgi:dTDP-4-dehydrorhamnose reductase
VNILLFGENGFLGKEVKKLIFNCKKNKYKNKYKIDLSKTNLISDYLKKKNPDIIINCAVKANFKIKNSKQMREVNYLAVKKMVEYCIKYKKTLIQISGTIVHPFSKFYNIKSKISPKNFYGKTKWLAEKFILQNKSKMKFKIIRFGGIYGINGPDHLFLNKLINKKANIFSGNLKDVKNYIHVKDAAKCIEKLIKIKRSGIYYAGGQIVDFETMIKIINEKLKLNIHIKRKIKKKNIEVVKTENFFKPKPFGYYL